MTTRRARKKEARRLAKAEGITYTEALSRLEPAPASIYIRQPTAEQAAAGVTAGELGVSALGPDATPGQRAAAEAHWAACYDPDHPCLCSGSCDHGQACDGEWDETSPGEPDRTVSCTGRILHVDRYPGSLWGVDVWQDEYVCTNGDVCEGDYDKSVSLPNVPWGEHREGGGTLLYDRIRHPNFPDFDSDTPEHPDGDGSCRACGDDAFSGLICDGCRAAGWDDSYGLISAPDLDDHDYADDEYYADHESA